MAYGDISFHLKTPKKDIFEDTIDLNVSIILNSILKEEDARCGINSFKLGESQFRSSCGHINPPLSHVCGELFARLRDY